ncbi:hypothetical protein Trydic_g23327 [Trypoxylus dichotomus]
MVRHRHHHRSNSSDRPRRTCFHSKLLRFESKHSPQTVGTTAILLLAGTAASIPYSQSNPTAKQQETNDRRVEFFGEVSRNITYTFLLKTVTKLLIIERGFYSFRDHELIANKGQPDLAHLQEHHQWIQGGHSLISHRESIGCTGGRKKIPQEGLRVKRQIPADGSTHRITSFTYFALKG